MSAEYEYVRYDKEGSPISVDYRGMSIIPAGRPVEFGDSLLAAGVRCILKGEVEVGKNALKHCIYAKMGFEGLAEQTGRPLENLTLMFSNGSSPKMQDFFEVISHIQEWEGIRLEVNAIRPEKTNGKRRFRGRYTRNRPSRSVPLAERQARAYWEDYLSRTQ